MTSPAEDALYAALTDIESLEVLARHQVKAEVIPTVSMRQVVGWALDYYFESGRKQAPSRELLIHTWAEVLEEAEVDLVPEDEEVDTIESAIDSLNIHYIGLSWQKFLQEMGPKVISASPVDRFDVLVEAAEMLHQLVDDVSDHTNEMDSSEGFRWAIEDYKQRVAEGTSRKGLAFGMPKIDEHIFGVHPGELAILAAGPKVGKSLALALTALREFDCGRRTVLYTLENTVEMTWGRIACMKLGLSARAFQRGELPEEKVEEVEKIIAEGFGDNLIVLQPEPGQRTPAHLIRGARMRGAESLIIDQLSHVEHLDPGRKASHEIAYEIVHDIKREVSRGREPIATLLAHQINREGVKKAAKDGFYDMTNLAGTSGVERAADFVFGLNQTEFQRGQGTITWQMMAARRTDLKHWEVAWGVDSGQYRVLREVTLGSGTAA